MFVIALFFCSAGRGTAYSSIVVGKPNMDIEVRLILENSTNSEFLTILDIDKYKHNLRPCCNEVLERICNTSCFEESVLSQQNLELWNRERQFRKQDNWEKNVSNCFWPKKFSSKYTEYGKKFEKEAREIYCSRNRYKVTQLGLVICGQYPWLACSPDGVVIKDGIPSHLVVIKCPYEGIENDAIHVVHSCSYLQISAKTGITLKKKYSYYGQVQLGMAILNLFFIFSKGKNFPNNMYTI
nr:unnamed protein product [Callosobruchus analis]